MEPYRVPGSTVGDGRFEILSLIGRGSFRRVYAALDRQTRERVALKELSLAWVGDWKTVELFAREARVLATLSHPGIPRHRDFFTEEGGVRSFLVEELIEGDNLAVQLAGGWAPSVEELRALALGVLEVLVYLESRDPPVVHRDVKPSNLIRCADGRVVMVDFGAVRESAAGQSSVGSTAIGTLGYMAPEQLLGRATPASDRYGLGATLVHLLCRAPPSDLPLEKLRPNFRVAAPEVPADFARWLDGLIEPAPEDRWASAEAARQALSGASLVPAGEAQALARAERPEGALSTITQDGASLAIDIPGPRGQWVEGAATSGAAAFGVVLFVSGGPHGLGAPLTLMWFALLALPALGLSFFRRARDGRVGRVRLTVGPQRFRVERRFLGLRRTHEGDTRALSDISEESYFTKDESGDSADRATIVLDEGGREHRFGAHLSKTERAWIIAELRRQLGLKKS